MELRLPNHPLEHHPVANLLVEATALEVAVGLAGGHLHVIPSIVVKTERLLRTPAAHTPHQVARDV